MERSYRDGLPIRVFRSSRLTNEYAPASIGSITAYRHDGLYNITQVNNCSGDIIKIPIEKRFHLSMQCVMSPFFAVFGPF